MSVLGAILLVLAGLAIMAFGIFLFYAWLPLFYGLWLAVTSQRVPSGRTRRERSGQLLTLTLDAFRLLMERVSSSVARSCRV